jgi:hypothetical protein
MNIVEFLNTLSYLNDTVNKENKRVLNGRN